MVRKQTRLGGFFIVCEKTIFFQSTEQRVGEIAKNQLPGRRNNNCGYGGTQSRHLSISASTMSLGSAPAVSWATRRHTIRVYAANPAVSC
jgi:hypothetical protein